MKARVPGAAGQAGGFGIEEQQVHRVDGIVAFGEGQRERLCGNRLRQERLDQMQAGRDLVARQKSVGG
ncbi:UNVERIFIED_ORG: hypothetical protein ABIB63_002031 [Xanthomonas axonopodis]